VGAARFEDLDEDGAYAAAGAVDEDAVTWLGIRGFEDLGNGSAVALNSTAHENV
jgi:hypothetical protein